MGCFTKLGLFVLNFGIFAAGVAVVALASIIINKDNTYGNLLGDGVFTLPIIILIAGLIIVIIGFLGCCGAMKESACMLRMYAVIVGLMLIAEVTLGILLLVYPSQAENAIIKGMTNLFEDYGGEDASLTKSIDSIQHDLHCCGVNNYTDWVDYQWSGGVNVTDSCCIEEKLDCGMNMAYVSEVVAVKTIYTQGCYYGMKEDLKDETIGLGVVLFLMAIVQVLSITCACGLASKSGSSNYA